LKDKYYFKTLRAYLNSCLITHRFGCIAAEQTFLILAVVFQVFTLGIFVIVDFWFLHTCSMTSFFKDSEETGAW